MVHRLKLRFGLFMQLVSFLLFIQITGCSKKAVPTSSAKPAPAAVSAKSVEDNLPGVWKLSKIEIPQMAEKMASFGSATDKDDMNKNLTKYQEGLKGLTVTFNKDHSYSSIYNGQSDLGTWRLSDKNEVYTVSKITDNTTIFEITSLTDNTMQVKYSPAEATLLLTLIKN